MAPAVDRQRAAAVSRQLAQIGTPGQQLDVLAGGDVDSSGRLLTVAELQAALRIAVQRSHPDTHPGHRGGHHPPAGEDEAAPPEPPGPHDDRAADAEPAAAKRAAGAGTDIAESQPAVPDPVPAGPAAGGGRHRLAEGEWGANPVPVRVGSGQRPVPVPRTVRDRPAAAAGVHRFPVPELLRLRPQDRDLAAARVLSGRWPGPRRVLLASLTGGAGGSTTAALMCAAAAAAGTPVLLLDAAGGEFSELPGRVGAGAGSRRDWTRLTGREAVLDFAALRRRAGADGRAVTVVAVTGDAGTPPPAGAVAAGAAAAARAWPLVLVDIPHGRPATSAAVRAGGVDLLVLVCRADPAEIDAGTGFLRDLAAGGDLDCAQRAVLAVRADRRGLPRSARRALAAVADTAAGAVTVAHVPRLTARRAAADGPAAAAAGRLLAAAAALTPTTNPATPDIPTADVPAADVPTAADATAEEQ